MMTAKMPATLRPGRFDRRTRSARANRIAPTIADTIRAAGLMSSQADSNVTQGSSEPAATARAPAMATTSPVDALDEAAVPRAWGRSSTQKGQPGGGAGQDGSGRQPAGTCQPGGGEGQPGGGLKTTVMAVSFRA